MWSDRETTHDCLGFESYVESLAGVCLEAEIAPLTLGIFGSWGSGKTSLMKMLQVRIETQPPAGQKVKTVWANAWRYENKDEIQSALVYAILGTLQEEKGLLDDAKDVLDRLKSGASVLKLGKFIGKTLLTLSPDIGGFIDCFKEESEKLAKTMAQFEKDFETLLQKIKVDRVVVFIDDLDRCQSAKVIETFETIKLFLNIPECTFVVGADAAKIDQAIREHYRLNSEGAESVQTGGRSFAEDYLEKIVQIPFRIPEQGIRDIACYTGMLALRLQLTPEAWQELLRSRGDIRSHKASVHEGFVDWLTKRDESLFRHGRASALRVLQRSQPYVAILARGLRGNPRQIKRFLNILELRERLATANKLKVAEDILIKVLVLEYTWKSFFQEVAENYDPNTGRSDLLTELVRLHKEGKREDPDSPIVTQALTTPGLPEFVSEVPTFHELDLTPYLFLAQTAFHVRPSPLAPPDEAARAIAERIAGTDRIKSKAAAREASKAESSVATAIVRALAAKLNVTSDKRVQVNIVNGLATICVAQPGYVNMALESLRDVDYSANEALALAAGPLLEAGKKAGLDVKDLQEKVTAHSKIAKALSTPGLSTGTRKPRVQ